METDQLQTHTTDTAQPPTPTVDSGTVETKNNQETLLLPSSVSLQPNVGVGDSSGLISSQQIDEHMVAQYHVERLDLRKSRSEFVINLHHTYMIKGL